MDNPTKVLTIGIGALAAVAAYLGLQNTEDVPEIIDSDIHDYDSKANLEKKKKIEEVRLEKLRLEKLRLEEVRLEEVRLKKLEEVRLEEVRLEMLKEEKLKEEKLKEEMLKEENTVEENVKMEVKDHMDKLPNDSHWGTFWKSEYNDIKSTNN